jgi:hypothetical protein
VWRARDCAASISAAGADPEFVRLIEGMLGVPIEMPE